MKNEVIPQIIHYCWFGNNPKPAAMLRYIESWKKFLPNYEIKEWNETNFDIECCPYVQEAYQEKKYAFVSDYARLYALYHYGGVYLDTDVEVMKDLSPLLNKGDCIFGFEEKNYIATSTMMSKPKQAFIKQYLDSYHSRNFLRPSGTLDMTTNVQHITNMLLELGLKQNGEQQNLRYSDSEIMILPQVHLSPFDYINHKDKSNEATYTIHHFDVTWASPFMKFKKSLRRLLKKVC